MTLYYDIQAVPNQRFSTIRGNSTIAVEIRTFRGICYVSVWKDGELLCGGAKAMPNMPIFPDPVNRSLGGVFQFVSATDDYPCADLFAGASCRLAFEEA